MPDYHIPLLPGRCYHLLAQAIGSEKLFLEKTNYAFFLTRLQQHVLPIAEICAYILLPNHIHLLVRIREQPLIEEQYRKAKENMFPYPAILPDFIMERFSNLLNSYCKAFNKRYGRKGSLFVDYLRREDVTHSEAFCATVHHIHHNAVYHQHCKIPTGWQWSSYSALTAESPTWLGRAGVLKYFDGKEAFIAQHHLASARSTMALE